MAIGNIVCLRPFVCPLVVAGDDIDGNDDKLYAKQVDGIKPHRFKRREMERCDMHVNRSGVSIGDVLLAFKLELIEKK